MINLKKDSEAIALNLIMKKLKFSDSEFLKLKEAQEKL